MSVEHLSGHTFDGTAEADFASQSSLTVKGTYRAGGAIAVGAPVVLDSAAAVGSFGVSVIEGTDALEHLFVGVYTGKGGTGAVGTVTNLTDGNAAVDGDTIEVVTKGLVYALVNGNTVDLALDGVLTVDAGLFLQVSATPETDVVDGLRCIATPAEAATGVSNVGSRILIL